MARELRYWNMYTDQLPKLWTGTDTDQGIIKQWAPRHVIRVVGHQHTLSCLRSIYQIAYNNPDYEFMVYSTDMIVFQEAEFPANVIPVLQVQNLKHYKEKIKDYLEICEDRNVTLPTLSIICTNVIHVSKKIKWIMLSGSNPHNIRDTIRMNSNNRHKVSFYVEKLGISRQLPEYINIREVPTEILSQLAVDQTLQLNGVQDVKNNAI